MKKLAIINIGTIVSGLLNDSIIKGDSIVCKDGVIEKIGFNLDTSDSDVILDAKNTTVIPGLIDSHCHIVLGDYTPRQKQVDFLDSYVHGGITSVVSAGEGVHAPGRQHDPVAAKALAIAAFKCYEHFHPNGMKVNGGSVILEPGLKENDFEEMSRIGVRYAKFGFGAYKNPLEGKPEVINAQKHQMIVMAHSGGTSLPGSSPIDHEMLLELQVDVCGHFNGGTTSLDDEGVFRVIKESKMALQIVQAGNLRSALHIVNLAKTHECLERICIGSDTPTGTGVMPLAIMKSICELSSLGNLSPAMAIALATGNNASIFKLSTGTLEGGKPCDLVVCDAPAGSVATNAIDAIARGDIPGISCVIIDGKLHVGRSRNTPLAKRLAVTQKGTLPGGTSH
jgi:enamidase